MSLLPPLEFNSSTSASRRWVMPAHRFRTVQQRHFLLCVASPTLIAIVGLFFLPEEAFSAMAFGLWAGMWTLVGGFGISVGFHRHFSHRGFCCSTWLRYVLAGLGSMACQGPLVYWCAIHRRHHSLADQPGDLHSPAPAAHGTTSKVRAFVQGHVGWAWKHDVPMPTRYAGDLLGDPVPVSSSRYYWGFVAMGYIAPALVGWMHWGGAQGLMYGMFWGGAFRVAVGHQIIWSINSICHAHGSRPASTGDQSANVWWLSLLSFGESWHNNHHAAATSARFGRGRQLDLGWYLIKLLGAIDRNLAIRLMPVQPTCVALVEAEHGDRLQDRGPPNNG